MGVGSGVARRLGEWWGGDEEVKKGLTACGRARGEVIGVPRGVGECAAR